MSLHAGVAVPALSPVIRSIEQGEEPRRILSLITEQAAGIAGVSSAALFLPSEKNELTPELVARAGDGSISEQWVEPNRMTRAGMSASGLDAHCATFGDLHYFEAVCLGVPVGALIVRTSVVPDAASAYALRMLAHQASLIFERLRLSARIQSFLDRLEALNELNQMIASNVGLQRIVKGISRESAFRFAADVTITLLLEQHGELEAHGSYGCAPSLIPKPLSSRSGVLGQVMRTGGDLCIPQLSLYQNHNLQFLEKIGIRSVNIACLEVRGEALGAIVIGFKREAVLSQSDMTRFGEFCQAGAVAISNARTREQVTSYTERLEEIVESRTADLAIQTARAEEANHAKSQFLANMSHELRTPLTAIVGYSSVLADGVFGPLNEKQRDALLAITRSSDHLKTLIDDVLNLARIESGKEDPEPEQLPLRDLLTQSYKLIVQTAVGKGVSLEPTALSDDMQDAMLYVDAKHMHQIIINLMSNAVKYTPRGGKVWLTAESVVDKIKISVRDTGVGIPPHKLAKLFERFERGEDTYSKNQEGTGIGLNLTRRLVELNGGRIGVESVEGQGSIFWILMPIAQQKAGVVVHAPVEPETTPARLDGLSTLVVDDNQDTCDVLKHILEASGATVRTATSVKEGMNALHQTPPDIVLTDLAIPGESGLVLIEHIRKQQGDIKGIPILVLSACAFDNDREASLKAGASLFVPKPFKPQEIIRTVRNLTLSSALRT